MPYLHSCILLQYSLGLNCMTKKQISCITKERIICLINSLTCWRDAEKASRHFPPLRNQENTSSVWLQISSLAWVVCGLWLPGYGVVVQAGLGSIMALECGDRCWWYLALVCLWSWTPVVHTVRQPLPALDHWRTLFLLSGLECFETARITVSCNNVTHFRIFWCFLDFDVDNYVLDNMFRKGKCAHYFGYSSVFF